MGQRKDFTGVRIDRLLVVSANDTQWDVVCNCGTKITVKHTALLDGKRSCGCLHKERLITRNKSHGLRDHPLYDIWSSMKQRCENPRNKDYQHYGQRGITLCTEWHDFKVFYDWSIVNNYKKPLQIDRRDNNVGYSPENCHFVTRSHNMINRRGWGKHPKNIRMVKSGKYIVKVRRDGVEKHIGTYDTVEQAVTARDKYLNNYVPLQQHVHI